MSKIPTIEEMLKAGMHFGHRTSKWHPKMKEYIFGARKGIHIIDLEKAQKSLEEALAFMEKSASEGKVMLAVGTKAQAKRAIKEMAVEAGIPYVSEKWIGGLLTNFPVIKKMIKKYNDLLSDKESGQLEKYTKKERLNFDKEIARLDVKVGGVSKLVKVPDIVFIWDIKKEKTAFMEARSRGVTIIAACDTNVNPQGVDYVIPSNDDASKTIKLVLDLVKEAVLAGKNKPAQEK